MKRIDLRNSTANNTIFEDDENWRNLLQQAVANGITSTAEVTHKIYKKLSVIAQQHPSSIGYINSVVDEFSEIADEAFDSNSQTLEWLDLFGVIPVIGEVADLTNGLIYAIEGDGLNATLSVASAIPFVGYGSLATKYGLKVTNTLTGQTTKLVWKVTANGIDFGRRGQCKLPQK